jgi:citrate lyase subunit beta / citryl-CoA lyase
MPVKTSVAHDALPVRSMLYAPASSERLLARVFDAGADAVILDLEDAVAVTAKASAREHIATLLAERAQRPQRTPIFVRVNAVSTDLTADDLVGVVWPGLCGIKLPKVDSSDDVRAVADQLTRLERERGLTLGSITIMAAIETAAGVEAVASIAAASERIWCLSFGAADFALDTGAELSADGIESLYARSRLVVASRAAGRARPFDSVYPNLDDDVGLRANARASRRLGFQGKSVIHPRQLAIVHDVFSPSASEIERARRVHDAFLAAEARHTAAFQLDGALVDYAIFHHAQQILAWAHQPQRPGMPR